MTYNFFTIIKNEKFKEFLMEADKIHTVRVFNEEIAKSIIKYYDIKMAWVGMREDWDCTSDLYYNNETFNEDCQAQLSSYWASPILKDEQGREFDCFDILFRDDENDSTNIKMDNPQR